MSEEHPIQPIVRDSHGTVRFKENTIVRYLLDNGGIDLNKLATLPFCQNDREQFAQLIGYSLSGFGDLSYVSDRTYERAAMAWMATDTSAVQSAEGGVMAESDTEWTDLRCSQLADLQRVLRTIRDANSSNNFLTKMQEASEIADGLLDGPFPSFSMFLEMVAIRDRQQRRATAAPTAASEPSE